MSGVFSKLSAYMRLLRKDERGGTAVYFAFFSVLALGTGALVLDVGEMTVLRAQMQNRADAGAMAGAVHLNGQPGAQNRARDVAMDAMVQSSKIPGDDSSLEVAAVSFFSEIDPDLVAATGDLDSRFIQVNLSARRVDFLLKSFLDNGSGEQSATLNASATAGSNPFICHAPPLMMCDPMEEDPTLDLGLPENAGRQVALKPPPTNGTIWAPGNYGLLALPDGSLGADDIGDALAAVSPADCFTLDVTTATGVKTNKVQDGINARFDLPGGLPEPAPNVINYFKDPEIEVVPSAFIGSGNWDAEAYWTARHGGTLPLDLAGASRYQVYLYELGLTFGRKDRQTIYPINGALPAGFVQVTPPAENIPEDPTDPDNPDVDGVPSQSVASNGYARRLVKVALLQCVADDIKGSHAYPTNAKYVEMFVTQTVPDEPAGGIYGEVVRTLSATNNPDFHANVGLVK